MSRTPFYKLNLLLLFTILCASFAVITQFLIPNLFENVLLRNFALSPSSLTYSNWQKSSIPIYCKFYLFNITNVDEVIKGEKPILEEIGPYVFRHSFEKTNITWNDQNGTVEYQQIKRWIFEPTLTERSLDDEIVHANVPLLSAVFQIASAPTVEQYTAYESLNSLIEAFHMRAFLRNTVRHLLFDGYHDALLETASGFYPSQVSQTKFGWFYQRNNTASDGTYRIHTGRLGANQLGLLDTWNRENHITTWRSGERCRSLEDASPGDLRPPFFLLQNRHFLNYFSGGDEDDQAVKPSVPMFIGDMCRTFNLELQSHSRSAKNFNGISSFRYRAGSNMFNYSLPENQCYCQTGKCPPNGLYNVGVCAKGAPIFASLPHFLHADADLQNSVIGLRPSEPQHEFFIDFDKSLAIPINVNVRLQINLFIKKENQVELLENWSDDHELYLPQFWSTISASIDDPKTAQLNFLINLLPSIILSISALLMSVSLILLCYIVFFVISNYQFLGLNHIAKYESVSMLSKTKNQTKESTGDYDMFEL